MSLRTRLVVIMDVALRVPPLFLMDGLLQRSLGWTYCEKILSINQTYEEAESLVTDTGQQDDIVSSPLEQTPSLHNYSDEEFACIMPVVVARIFLYFLVYMAAFCVFLLSRNHLVSVYKHVACLAVILLSYWTNMATLKSVVTIISEEKGETNYFSILENMLSFNMARLNYYSGLAAILLRNALFQGCLSFLFMKLYLGTKFVHMEKLVDTCFLSPTIIATLPIAEQSLRHVPVFAALLPLLLTLHVMWTNCLLVLRTVHSGYLYARAFVRNFGLHSLLEAEWLRLNVPVVLRTFWITRLMEQAIFLVVNSAVKESGVIEWEMLNPEKLFIVAKTLFIQGCETLTAVLGMTSIVSSSCHYIGWLFQWILLTDDEDDKSIGTVSAILFFILALQTGLTGLDPEKRFVRLCRNFCLLFTALLHFLHNMVNPILMSLSASHSPSINRHARALLVCGFLITFPIILLYYLWAHHAVSTWLLAVSAFSVEVIIKVVVSLMIYALFLFDAYRNTFWEGLDDYVYYIRAFGNTVEFCFGIFLFFNGAWILIFESGGTIRAIMMGIHAYFNIWCEAKAGWSVFMKRRTAVNKINTLPEATDEQLSRFDDVCAICFQEMLSAKITRCNHYFHGMCLRKWLYVQDRCPLCHEVLYLTGQDSTAAASPQPNGQVAPGVAVQGNAVQPPPGDGAGDNNANVQ